MSLKESESFTVLFLTHTVFSFIFSFGCLTWLLRYEQPSGHSCAQTEASRFLRTKAVRTFRNDPIIRFGPTLLLCSNEKYIFSKRKYYSRCRWKFCVLWTHRATDRGDVIVDICPSGRI